MSMSNPVAPVAQNNKQEIWKENHPAGVIPGPVFCYPFCCVAGLILIGVKSLNFDGFHISIQLKLEEQK